MATRPSTTNVREGSCLWATRWDSLLSESPEYNRLILQEQPDGKWTRKAGPRCF